MEWSYCRAPARTAGTGLVATVTGAAPGPLAGMRVIDLATILLGPVATRMLGDPGADVIKVESPGGDAGRGAGPPPVEDRMGAAIRSNEAGRSRGAPNNRGMSTQWPSPTTR